MYARLQIVLQTMQRAAASAEKLEIDEATLALDRVIVQYNQTNGLGEHPLPPAFLYDLLEVRAALLAYREGVEFIVDDEDLCPPITPDFEPGEAWNRLRCALESSHTVLRKLRALEGRLSLLERSVGFTEGSGSLSGFLIGEMTTAHGDIKRELDSGQTNFPLLVRLAVAAQVYLVVYCLLDPQASTWSLRSELATALQNIEEAQKDPFGPRDF
jgi:hypothetical protein